ncbi:26S proteasome regulatory subunit 7 [Microbotryomycetes sp. JL221]|nr:26S proteasome regulatory subunit 7 [Microbotryomycetes sp. JL221]
MPFSKDELEQALSEVGPWGLSSYRILPKHMCASDSEARAQLELLDGQREGFEPDKAVISVSERGWQVCLRSHLPTEPDDKDDTTFETLDDLLLFLSPAFRNKRDTMLFDKLASLQQQQQQQDGK